MKPVSLRISIAPTPRFTFGGFEVGMTDPTDQDRFQRRGSAFHAGTSCIIQNDNAASRILILHSAKSIKQMAHFQFSPELG